MSTILQATVGIACSSSIQEMELKGLLWTLMTLLNTCVYRRVGIISKKNSQLEKTFSSTTKSIYAPAGNGAVEDTIAGRTHARFIEQWSYSQFPEDGDTADEKSKQYFLAKCGRTKLDELITQNSDKTWKKKQFYPYSLTSPELVRNTWRHPVSMLDAMFDSSLVLRGELLPESIIGIEVFDRR
ncbi:hypothetical protein DFS33DRAFT_1271514 [Desarmillaria ectypa]|nr:hypothetical protein DFS33DRAFT_1271514 [Desarmillaria ectypa]